jgi:hypothetical protein
MRGYGYVDAAAMGIPTVEVFCQEESHAENRWEFPTFGKVEGEWIPLQPIMQSKRLRSKDDFMAAIDRSTKKRVRLPADSGVDLSYNFECHECGLAVPARAENLQPIFDAISAANFGADRSTAGGPSISLTELKARLSRPKR